ncbi:unnamed protein product [Lactuca virosa]|uniref:Methyltransferase domain-containing protein n=1 Tax=Lactuca virosa TaxID=75947 RepID=A0AAU9LFG3_9ASTR|nr:unnamed protein product [Lactuca virosa]
MIHIDNYRGIDYVVANNEISGRAPDLPYLIKTEDKDLAGWSVLDVGTGNGLLLQELAKQGFSDLIGIDYSEGAINLARSLANRDELIDAIGLHQDGPIKRIMYWESMSRLVAPGGLLEEPVDKTKHWGDLEEEEEEEEEEEVEEQYEEGDLEDGIQSVDTLSSIPTGVETPDVIDLRKQQRKEPEKPLYQVIFGRVSKGLHKFLRRVDIPFLPLIISHGNFWKSFKGAAQILEKGGYSLFTPHYITWYCPQAFTISKQCKSQCINHGRYCAPDPEQDFSTGYEGKDLVIENLRQLCVFKVENESGKAWIWWDYVTYFQIRCPMKEKYNKECVDEVIKSLELDLGKIEKCMGDPNADSDNIVLKEEQDAQIGKGSRGDVTILPTLVVNNRHYRGKLEKGVVLKAICSGFEETTEPAVCLSDGVETNECLENNGGCWHDKSTNVTACKDTFRGRVCECPLVDGVQFNGDGYTSCKLVEGYLLRAAQRNSECKKLADVHFSLI